MNDYKTKLMEMARKRFPNHRILPCGNRRTIDQCFVFEKKEVIFWFNTTKDNSTRVVIMKRL